VPRVIIARELYKEIEAQARREGIPVSRLVERLLVEATREKVMYCPRCAFRF